MEPTASKNESNGESEADWPLVKACQLGDRNAQHRLYELYGARVFRLTMRMASRQDAEDLTQQVFLQVYRKIDQFSGKAVFGTWLYRVAVNEVLQHRRRNKQRPVQMPDGDFVDDRKDNGAYAERELLECALAGIEPNLRDIFLLREVDQLSYSQLAETLGIPAGTVASRLNRARRDLQAELSKFA